MQSKYIYRKKPCGFSVPEKSNICGWMTLVSCQIPTHPAALPLLLLNRTEGENKMEKLMG